MRYRTYKNMVRATQMIADKGYDWDEANQMAIKIFDNYMNKDSNSVEFYIGKIMPKQEWLEYMRNAGGAVMKTIMAMVNNYGEVICELEQDGCWYKVPAKNWGDVTSLLCEGDEFRVEAIEVED